MFQVKEETSCVACTPPDCGSVDQKRESSEIEKRRCPKIETETSKIERLGIILIIEPQGLMDSKIEAFVGYRRQSPKSERGTFAEAFEIERQKRLEMHSFKIKRQT